MRRRLLATVAGAVTLAGLCATEMSAQSALPHGQALSRLKAGNERFQKGRSLTRPLGAGVRRTLARGQSPYAIIVTSADSRVVPEHLFNAGLGELFVIRNAGNVCDPETLASIEYAADVLGTRLCVVLAQEGCPAIRLAARSADQHESPAIEKLAQRMAPALRRARQEGLEGVAMLHKAEEENAHQTVADCLRRSKVLQQLRRRGEFRILAARYRLQGRVDWLPERLHEADLEVLTSDHRQKQRGLPPHVVLSMLQAGHRRYLSTQPATGDVSRERRDQLATAEQAVAVVVTCSDSRVVPEHLFDAGLGELYVIRVAGNVLNDEILAAIEYAVANTGASLCLVLGHEGCGAVGTAIDRAQHKGLSVSMRHLLQKIQPSLEAARHRYGTTNRDELLSAAVEFNVLRFVNELRSRSAFVRHMENEGRFGILPALYMLRSGNIRWLKDGSAAELAASARSLPAAPAGETASEQAASNLDIARLPTIDEAPNHLVTSSVKPAVPGTRAPKPAVDYEKARRQNRALLFTVMAAAMVAIAGILGLLLWQRRSPDQTVAEFLPAVSRQAHAGQDWRQDEEYDEGYDAGYEADYDANAEDPYDAGCETEYDDGSDPGYDAGVDPEADPDGYDDGDEQDLR